MVRITSEWDFGQENMVFRTEARAQAWLDANLNLKEFLEENGYTQDELKANGHLGFQTLEEEGE